MIWHHERFGTGFFNDDPAMTYAVQVGNHYHNDLLLAGHTHSRRRDWKSEMLLVGQGPPSPTVVDPAQAGCWP